MFKKTVFYIAISPKSGKIKPNKCYFQKVTGWGETFNASDGSVIEIGLSKRLGNWFVTEASTGMPITTGVFATRADAIASLTPDLVDSIAYVLRCPEMITAAERLDSYKRRIKND